MIRTVASGITFVETQLRAGRPPWPGPRPELPLVLGSGVAGQVVALGDGVDQSVLGREVVTATGGFGGYASQVVVNAADPIPIPEGLGSEEAVALLADGRTALALARAAAITESDRVLVLGAAGGVGSLLLQLARNSRARVMVAAAGSERKLAFVRDELGATTTVDYTVPDWHNDVRSATWGFDVAFDGVGGALGRAAFELVVPGGRFIRYGAASGAMTDVDDATQRSVTVIAGNDLVRSPADNLALVEQALADATAGRFHPVIGQRFPLSRASDAHAALEGRATIGKTILIPEPSRAAGRS